MANYANLLAAIAANVYTNHNQEVTAAMVEAALQSMVSSLGDGYQYMGVATPATILGTPDERVFWIATQAGTYDGGLSVQQGLSVLTYDTSWSVTKVWGVDDVPVVGSGNLVKSGGVLEALSSGDTDSGIVNGIVREIYDAGGVLASADRFRLVTTGGGDRQFWVYDSGGTALLSVTLPGDGTGVFYSGGVYFYIPVYEEFDESGVSMVSANASVLEKHPHILEYIMNDRLTKEEAVKFRGKPTSNDDVNAYRSPEIYDPTGKLDTATRIQFNVLSNGFRQIYVYDGGTTLLGVNVVNVNTGESPDNRVFLLGGVYFYIGTFPASTTSYNATMNTAVTHNLNASPHIYNQINLINKVSQRGRNIAWYGTSIPAGSTDSLSYTGFATTYKREFSNYNLTPIASQNAYPAMVASLLGANVYNHAVGSSKIAKSTSGDSLLWLCKSLSNTIEDICDFLTGCYNIDWDNQTYSRNTSNVYGVTTFLSDATWSDLMTQFRNCLSYSYEVSLVCHHLIPSGAAHDAYVSLKFGTYLTDFEKGLDIDGICAYVSDADLFVFDHGFNDSNFTGNVDSSDPTTFYGAYNLIISTLYFYKSGARAIILSDYIDNVRCEYQENVAKRWGIPFAYIPDMTPSLTNVVIKTQGYWDSGYKWHNSGFTWTDDGVTYTSNNQFFDGKTLAEVQAEWNPEQVDGVWVWSVRERYTWVFDTVHPHSDKGGRVNKIIASALAEFIQNIGDERNPKPQTYY